MNECEYCLKDNYYHGGNCSRVKQYHSTPCLIYEKDTRGKPVRNEKIKLEVNFGSNIPELFKPDNDWVIDGINKTITVTKIHDVDWDTNTKGLHGITMTVDYWYWSEENGVLPEIIPKLKLVKG